MSRRVDGWPDLGRVLAAALATETPAWVRPETREHAAELLASLSADVAAVVASQSQRAAAKSLGVALSTVEAWIGARGWARVERDGGA